MRYLLSSVLILIAGISFSQPKALLNIPKTGKNIEAFIPAGFDTIATAKGDLNKDKEDDFVMVLRHKMEKSDKLEEVDSIPPRLLVILFHKAGVFSLAGASDSAILCKYCGGVFGDPLEGVEVEKGILMIHHYGGSAWRWAYTHKFRFQNNDFFLIGKTKISYWDVENCDKLGEFAGTDYEDVNLVTGQYEKKKVSEEGCKLLVNKKGKRAVKPLVRLNKFSIEKD